MKTYKNLFDKLIDPENIYNAIINASRSKRKRPDVKKVLNKIMYYVWRLQDLITQNKLKFRKHNAVPINDGIKAKLRIIVKPDFVYEQILHHAFVQVLKPIFMKSMYVWSCGSLPKRGGLYGKRFLAKYIKNHQSKIKYCFKCDIRHFFQSVDIEIVKQMLSRKIKDKRFLQVLFLILDSNIAVYNDEDIYMGLPIGWYIAQWLANWILTPVDYKIKQKLFIKCYVRYVDDLVLLHQNKKELHKARSEIQRYLQELRLELKPNYQVFRFAYTAKDGKEKGRCIDFMGYKFYRNRTVLRKSIILKATRKASKIYKTGKLNWYECSQMVSYLGWFKHANVYSIYAKYIQPKVNIGDCKKVISLHAYRERKKQNVVKLENSREFRKTA